MQIQRMILLSAASLVALVLIQGCGATATERDFGNSARAMIEGQTANPMAVMVPDPEPVATGDGQRLKGVVDAFREPPPERTQPEIRSNPFMGRN